MRFEVMMVVVTKDEEFQRVVQSAETIIENDLRELVDGVLQPEQIPYELSVESCHVGRMVE